MDSLRYWVLEMHVDGFRFDLAAALARELHDVDRLSRVLRPGPAGPGGVPGEADRRAVGRGRGRLPGGQLPAAVDGVERQVPRHACATSGAATPSTLPEFASRLTGSSDLYETSGRRPVASINFVTCHDGFTLPDLVSYDRKHNEANGEDNRDGTDDNRSWNCGAEGPADDPEIKRAAPAASAATSWPRCSVSQGVPMLLAGDEIGRTQRGNNNAYCQDNEISWVDWALRRAPRPTCWTSPASWPRCGASTRSSGGAGSSTAAPARRRPRATSSGSPRPAGRWPTRTGGTGYAKSLEVFLNGDAITEPGPRGERIRDDSFLLLFNAHHEDRDRSPCRRRSSAPVGGGARHRRRGPRARHRGETWPAGAQVPVVARSIQILRLDDEA